MSLDAQIQSLVANFREQLSEALSKSNNHSSMLSQTQRSSHEQSSSNAANDSGVGAEDSAVASVSFLVQLWQQSGEPALTLSGRTVGARRPPEDEELRSLSPDLEESLRQAVIVMGPPGTEPRQGLSEGRFDKMESIVYKRNTTHVPLSRQAPAPKVRGVVPKDTPRPPLEVFVCPRREEGFENRRWTRWGARAIRPTVTRLAEVVYVEDSESSSSESSDAGDVRSKTHTFARQQQGHSKTTPLPLPSTAPLSVVVSGGLEANPPKPLDSSSLKEEDGTGESSKLTSGPESSSGDSCVGLAETMEMDDDLVWEPVAETVSTPAAESTRKRPPRISVGSGTDLSETPLSSPSGIHTVLNDLRHSYPLAKRKRLSTGARAVKQKPVGASFIPIRATPRIKPCSVVVKRLPWKVVVECMRRQHARKVAAKSESQADSRSTPASRDSGGYRHHAPASVRTSEQVSVNAKLESREPATPVGRINRRPPASAGSAPADWSSDSDFELKRPSVSLTPASERTPLSGAVRGSAGKGLVQASMDGFSRTRPSLVKSSSATLATPPDIIHCTACGKGIKWKEQQIHEHKRLEVLICQHCWKKYNTGDFMVEDGSENYCTLCGDGGEMVCCDFCEKSLCRACIAHVSGEPVVRRLLDDDVMEWRCYVCDPSPLAEQRKTCAELCNYYRRINPRARRSLDFQSSGGGGRGDREGGSGCGNGSSGCGEGKSSSGCGNDSGCGNGKSSGRGDGKSSSGRGDGKSSSGRGDGKSSSGRGDGKSSSGRGDGKSSSGRGDGKSSRQGKDGSLTKTSGTPSQEASWSSQGRKPQTPGDSDSDSSSAESLEVQSDDISMSDSDLLSELSAGRRRRKKRRASNSSDAGDDPGMKKEGSSLLEGGGDSASKLSSKKRVRNFLLDSDSDFESPVASSPARKKKRNLSTTSSGGDSDNILGSARKSAKKSRLAGILSSASDSDDESPQKYQLEFPNGDIEGHFDQSGSDASPAPDGSIKYATRKGGSGSSSDFDSDVVFLGRKKKRAPQRQVISDRGSETADSADEEARTKPARRRGRKSGDDFPRDFSRLGPRIRRGRVRRTVLGSSSSSDDREEAEEEAKGDREENEGSGEENSQEGSPDKGTPGRKRKKIRKLIATAKLDEKTREAQRLERERLDRLKKKAKDVKDDSQRLILEQDSDTKEVLVEVRHSLLERIMPHQRQGIKFLYDACVESLERLRSGQKSGAILAHCMGLGKTVQVIAFLDALLCVEESGIRRVIILAPVNTLHNWRNEFEKWISYDQCDYRLYMLTDTSVGRRLQKLLRWFQGGGLLFLGYDMYRNLAQGKRMKKKRREDFQRFLLDPGPDIIICDEGHVMRNSKSNLSQVLGQVRTRCRVVLTGTPLQNNLLEYYTMVNFVKPNLLGTIKEFKNRFVNPITNGQCRDSTPHDVRRMKMSAHVLHVLLAGTVQRRDYRVLTECLPPKQEYVLAIRLTPVQDQLYRRFLEHGTGMHTQQDLFTTFSTLAKVWNHPWVLKLSEDRQRERELEWESDEEDDDTSLGGFIVSEGSDVESPRAEPRRKGKRKKGKPHSSSTSRSTTPANDIIVIDDDDSTSPAPSSSGRTEWTLASHLAEHGYSLKQEQSSGGPQEPHNPTSISPPNAPVTSSAPGPSAVQPKTLSPTPNAPWYRDLLTGDMEGKLELSGKLQFLLGLLQEAEQLKEKVLVFTQSLLTLDLIESTLNKLENGDWTPGLDYYRLDGSTKADLRCSYMSDFNCKNNDRMRLFLISTRAGSLGVNLVAANRVVIFDACWNPSHDLQAVFRTYRFGQTKPIFVYRLLAKGTMEEKIYDRQVTKQSLSMRVVDEKQIGRHYTTSELHELFTYSPAPPPDPQLQSNKERPQADMVLCSLLDKLQPQCIISYHEHDSLLEHVFDEELSEEDRKAAWENHKAQMAAESKSYNMQALQSRLEEQMARQGPQSVVEADAQGSSVIMMLQTAVRHVKELVQLQQRQHQLSYQAQHPEAVHAQQELAVVNTMINEGYRKVAEGIEKVNNYLVLVNTGKITLPLEVTRNVNAFRQYLISELERFKSVSSSQALRLTPQVSSTTPRPGPGPGPSSQSQPTPFQATSLPPHGMGPPHSLNHHYHASQGQQLQSHWRISNNELQSHWRVPNSGH